jgi:hypothetical protein
MCPHTQQRVIAQDETLVFVECLECGEILEKQPEAAQGTPRGTPNDESLSDA